MSKVFVLDTNKQPLDPVHPGRARILLTQGKAAVFQTLSLHDHSEERSSSSQRSTLSGSRSIQGARRLGSPWSMIRREKWSSRRNLCIAGEAIKKALDQRRAVRRGRRQRKTRYRKPRFANRRRKTGGLPPLWKAEWPTCSPG